MSWRRLVGFLLLVSSMSFAAVFAEKAKNEAPIHFFAVSDIHFNPFLACRDMRPCPLIEKLQAAPVSEWSAIFAANDNEASQVRQDTGYKLLKGSLNAAKKDAEASHAQFVLALGDFLGHEFRSYYISYTLNHDTAPYRAFLKKTLIFISDELRRTFPDVNVYMIVGNNDTYHRDYLSQPKGAFFRDAAATWSTLIRDNASRASFFQTFPDAGYYAIDIPQTSSLKLIALNTVLFSEKGSGKPTEQAAEAQLKWLHEQLASARDHHQKVMIAMHIPVGIDVYASLHFRLFRMIEFWKREYTTQFEAELMAFAPEIIGIFCGHLHTDWFQMLTLSNANTVPVVGAPSISPIFGNNPGYKVYTYLPGEGRVEDFQTHYYMLDKAHSERSVRYRFANIWHPPAYA